MDRSGVIQRAWERLEPELREQGYELVEVEFGRHGASSLLRVFIDREGGLTLDDCQAVSQLLDVVLDQAGFIQGGYVLEVSSPGFDRPVRKPEDFQRFIGEKIKIRTQTPILGRKQFKGTLQAFRDGLIEMECDGTTHAIHIGNVHKANLDR